MLEPSFHLTIRLESERPRRRRKLKELSKEALLLWKTKSATLLRSRETVFRYTSAFKFRLNTKRSWRLVMVSAGSNYFVQVTVHVGLAFNVSSH